MSETKRKKIWEGDITCCHCSKLNTVKLEKEITVPSTPAEFEIVVTIKKAGTQTKLEDVE